MTPEIQGPVTHDTPGVPDDIFTSLDRVSEEVEGLVESHDRVRDGFVLGIVMMVLAVGYGLLTATPWTAWAAPLLPLLGAGLGWWGSRRERHVLVPLPDHPVGAATRLSMLRERVNVLSPGSGIQTWGHSLTRVASWFQLVAGGGLAVVSVGAWFLQDHPVPTLGIALVGLGLAGLGGIMFADDRRQEAIGAVGMELRRLAHQLERTPHPSGPVELRDRIALQNEVDELREERKEWIQAAALGLPGVFAIQYTLGELQSIEDIGFVLIVAIVGFGLLARPVLRKGSRIRELEERLEVLDAGETEDGSVAARAQNDVRSLTPVVGGAKRVEDQS